MNTLTRFFFHEADENQANVQHIEIAQTNNFHFELVEGETVSDCIYENITISGSLFSVAFFSNVTFKNCTFYANRIENCTFENCEFIDCKFEFTSFTHSNFIETEFSQTTFGLSSMHGGNLKSCLMDSETFEYTQTQQVNLSETQLSDEVQPMTFGFEEEETAFFELQAA